MCVVICFWLGDKPLVSTRMTGMARYAVPGVGFRAACGQRAKALQPGECRACRCAPLPVAPVMHELSAPTWHQSPVQAGSFADNGVTSLPARNRAAFLSCAALAGAAALASAVLYLRTRRWYRRLALRLRHA